MQKARAVNDPRLVNALEELVAGAVGMTTAALASSAARVDLTLPQWRALVVIARGDDVRVGDVATRMGLSTPSASRLIRRLERRGLVRTERDESDRRATLVRTTQAGLALWSMLVRQRRRLVAEILADTGPSLPKGLAEDLELLVRAFGRYG